MLGLGVFFSHSILTAIHLILVDEDQYVVWYGRPQNNIGLASLIHGSHTYTRTRGPTGIRIGVSTYVLGDGDK